MEKQYRIIPCAESGLYIVEMRYCGLYAGLYSCADWKAVAKFNKLKDAKEHIESLKEEL